MTTVETDPYEEGSFPLADWKRVGERIKERIPEIGINKSIVGKRGGPTLQPLNEYIAGKRVSKKKVVGLCKALDWSTDSIERILKGQPPKVQKWPHDDDLATEVGRLREEVARLREEIHSRTNPPER